MSRTPRAGKRLLIALLAGVLGVLISGCGGTLSPSGPKASSCGGGYRVQLPGGKNTLLGGCSGSLHAAAAPHVTVRVGDAISMQSFTDADGTPLAPSPMIHGQSLQVMTSKANHGLTVVKAVAAGRSTLVVRSVTCVSATGHRIPSCPVMHVNVTQ